jgi:hypothetical protein
MVFHRCARQQRGFHALGIGLLILSLVHTPLPEPDFHNLRHHDGPGEVCEHHDHLLRWHPGAGVAQDVAVLHWHWFVPTSWPSDSVPTGDDGPALHAHIADWYASNWDCGPSFSPDTSGRFASRPTVSPTAFAPLAPLGTVLADDHAPGPHPHLAFCATFAPRVSLATLLQRWIC